jgi:hypothetical protein
MFAVATASADITMFADDFEGMGTAVSPGTYASNLGGDYNPTGGSPGSWAITEQYADRIQVTNSTTSPDPGAYQGNNYLRIVRDGNENYAQMNFATQGMGQTYEWKANVYLPAEWAGNPMGILGNGGALFNIITNYDGSHAGAIHSYTGPWPPSNLASVSFAIGKWQQWKLDYTEGTANITLTVDGNSSTLPINASGALSLSNISIFSDMGSGCYLDAVSVTNVTPVPEPSTLVLLTGGLLGLLAYAWRKRR